MIFFIIETFGERPEDVNSWVFHGVDLGGVDGSVEDGRKSDGMFSN